MNSPEQHAKCIHVDRAIVHSSHELRSHVNGRADDGARHHGLGNTEAEVGEFGSVIFLQQNVFQLDVTVQKALGMEEANT